MSEGSADQPGPAPRDRAAMVDALLAAAADRAAVAIRLEPPGLERILRSIVDATASLFDAEAASIALTEEDGRLRFRVAAGSRGQGVVGMTVNAGEGVAGYVASTGQPLALTDVAREAGVSAATVDRVLNNRPGVRARTRAIVVETARRLGYLPDGIAAAVATMRLVYLQMNWYGKLL